MSEVHEKVLKELCIICGLLHASRGTHYEVEGKKDRIEKAFNFDFDIVTGVTPLYICNTCYRTVTLYEARVEKGLGYVTGKVPIKWMPHSDDCQSCQLYTSAKKGGRKKKIVRKGKEKTVGLWHEDNVPDSESHMLEFIKELDMVDVKKHNKRTLNRCICVICKSIMDKPLLFRSCCHGCCRECFLSRFSKTAVSETCCPECDVIADIEYSPLVLDMIFSLRTTCPMGCKELLTLEDYLNHQMTCKPMVALNKKVGDGIKTLLMGSSSKMLEFKTGGQLSTTGLCANYKPFCMVKVVKPRVDISKASSAVVRKRSLEVENIIQFESGATSESSNILKKKIIKRIPKDEREQILIDLGLVGRGMTAADGLSMLGNLGVTWYTYRAWGRWMRNFGLKCPSEKNMRITMKDWLKEQTVEAEMTPFQVVKDKQVKMVSAPMAYVKNLKDFIFVYLDMLLEEGLLVHHAFMNNEIHIKFGGDHGKNSYKQSFQVCNVKAPNSVLNTTVINVFKAKDIKPNLKTALLQYQQQISDLQNETWRGHKIRIFQFGDMAILYEMYGLSGASGRHNCIWCEINSKDLSIAPESRSPVPAPRTLKTLHDGYIKFRDNMGSDLGQAKDNMNIIDEYYFDIKLKQVVIPGLHITLGLFLKFFNLFEMECKQLDYRLQHYLDGTEEENDMIRIVKNKEDAIMRLEEGMIECTNSYNWQMIRVDENDQDERERLTNLYETHISLVEEEKQKKMKEVYELKKKSKMEKKGPTLKLVEEVLQRKRVQRQAFHSNSFTGNHCHTMLKEESYLELCKCPVVMVSSNCAENSTLVAVAHDIEERFTKLFSYFSSCHDHYDSASIVDYDALKSVIEDLMSFWRSTWPQETVTPKMHVLESHVLPFIKRWKVGLGFYGEQGGESLHKEFGKLEANHSGMNDDPAGQLKSIINKHHIKVCPKGRKRVPEKETRKLTRNIVN